MSRRREDSPEFHRELRNAITYNPATGEFTAAVATTRRAKGERVGTLRDDGSYIVSFESKLYTASRLAYFWMTGRWPKRPVLIKQKKRLLSDYRWANLEHAGSVHKASA
jgi:hypothetical protein